MAVTASSIDARTWLLSLLSIRRWQTRRSARDRVGRWQHFEPVPSDVIQASCGPCDVGAGGFHGRLNASAPGRWNSLDVEDGDRHDTILPGTGERYRLHGPRGGRRAS